MDDLITMAREAGKAGKSWDHWSASDEVQALISEQFMSLDSGAVEAAYDEGRKQWCLANWRIVWTTAPVDYDSFGTTTVEEPSEEFHGKKLRKVVIHPEHFVYQTSRYGSGLHPSWEEDPRVTEARAKERQAKLDEARAADEARRQAGIEWLKTATAEELDDYDTYSAHHVRSMDVQAEKARRREEAETKAREAEWTRCFALVHEGDTLIDDGEPSKRGEFGVIRGRDPHVYYNVKIVKGWPDDAEHAMVAGDGDRHGSMSLSYVADYIASGHLRIAKDGEVPPRPVVERIGHDRWKEIKRVEVDGRAVWVGRALFGSEPLVLDEKGHLVRAKRVVVEATAFYYRSI